MWVQIFWAEYNKSDGFILFALPQSPFKIDSPLI